MVRLPAFDEQVTVVTYGPAELVIAADAVTVPVEILAEPEPAPEPWRHTRANPACGG